MHIKELTEDSIITAIQLKSLSVKLTFYDDITSLAYKHSSYYGTYTSQDI